VCLFFSLNTDKKKHVILIKKRRPCVLSNTSIVAISVGLPVAVNNPAPASQVEFQNSVQFNAFALKVATNAVIVGTPVLIWNF